VTTRLQVPAPVTVASAGVDWPAWISAGSTVVLILVTVGYVVVVHKQLKQQRADSTASQTRWDNELARQDRLRTEEVQDREAWTALEALIASGLRPGEGDQRSATRACLTLYLVLERAAHFLPVGEVKARVEVTHVITWRLSNLTEPGIDYHKLSIHARRIAEECQEALIAFIKRDDPSPNWSGPLTKADALPWITRECR
jgi:hypothetical protein